MGLILLRTRFSVSLPLYALVAVLLSNAKAYQFHSRSYRSWMEKKAIVKRVAENNRCSDGRVPAVTEFKMIGDTMEYGLQCEDVGSRNSTNEAVVALDKRQTSSYCSVACEYECHIFERGRPDPQDCAKLTADLRSRGGDLQLNGMEFRLFSYKTCVYNIQNMYPDPFSFCFGAVAEVADRIIGNCGPQAEGGRCSDQFYHAQVYAEKAETSQTSVSSTQPSMSGEPPVSTSTSESASPSVLLVDSSGSTSIRTSSSIGITAFERSTTTSQTIPGGIYSNDNARNTTSIITSISTAMPTLPDGHKHLNTGMIVGITIGLIAIFALVAGVIFALRQRRRRKRVEYIRSQFAPGTPIEDARPWVMLPEETPFDEKSAIPLVGFPQETHNTRKRTTLAGASASAITPPNLNETRSRLRKQIVPSIGPTQGVRTMPRRNTLAGSTVPAIIVSSPNERRRRSLEQLQVEQQREREQVREQAQEQEQEQGQGQEQEQYEPAPTLRPHPRSTEALIAAAAPPNMSRDQIDQLTANFVSLVRGRDPQYEDESHEDDESGQEPPPYQGSL